MKVLAGDVGGTKTFFRLIEIDGSAASAGGSGTILKELRLESGRYSSFAALLSDFIDSSTGPISAAAFAVAGTVGGDSAKMTNLPWGIDASNASEQFKIPTVLLMNDFDAIAYGAPLLRAEDLTTLQAGERVADAPIAILGAGTGLGESIIVPDRGSWRVVSSEGGHCDFAPTSEEQAQLYRHLRRRFGHVSYERVLSGAGIVNIYDFLRIHGSLPDSQPVPAAHEVSERAALGDPVSIHAMELFVDIYGAEAGNLALKVLARGGVYLAGGIAAKNINHFTSGRFIESFLMKGRLEPFLRTVPVHVMLNPQVGLLGAMSQAVRAGMRGEG